jgi:hypothetical protein
LRGGKAAIGADKNQISCGTWWGYQTACVPGWPRLHIVPSASAALQEIGETLKAFVGFFRKENDASRSL